MEMQTVVLRKPLTVFKKVRMEWSDRRTVIEMKVPTGARIVIPMLPARGKLFKPLSEAYMRAYDDLTVQQGKSRVERVRVVSRTKRSGKGSLVSIQSSSLVSIQSSYSRVTYSVGKNVTPLNGFDLHPQQCSAGIHCFLTRGKAHRYEF